MDERRQQGRIELLQESLRKNGEARIRVHGGSMWPWLRPGDELLIRTAEFARLAPGEIVLFSREGRLFAHRALRRVRDTTSGRMQLLTKGDTLPVADAPVNEAEVLGRVSGVRRGGREFSLDTLPRVALGRVCALLTQTSRVWYPLARSLKRRR